MDVSFTEEQQALGEAVAAMLRDRCGLGRVREAMAGPTGADLSVYRDLIALGVGELPGLVELAVVLEATGRALVPAPIVSALGIAAPALAASAPAHPLRAAAAEGLAVPVFATEPTWVPEAHVATHVLFVRGDELAVAEAGACEITVLPTMDATRRLCTVAPPEHLEEIGPAAPALEAAALHGAVALAAEAVGVASACVELAVTHARTREQFGRPIGAYQAISHQVVDIHVATERARSLLYLAAWTVQEEPGQAHLAASAAKAAACDAAVQAAQRAIQVHGGIGFTWEHDLHLYLRRARAGAALLGSPAFHRARIADIMLA